MKGIDFGRVRAEAVEKILPAPEARVIDPARR